METVLPAGCGNAPRVSIVADVVSAWARNDDAALAALSADEALWTGDGTGADADARALAARLGPDASVQRLEFDDIITHGRLASCTGRLVIAGGDGGGRRIEFSHHLRFRSAGRTAPLVEVRTFLAGDVSR